MRGSTSSAGVSSAETGEGEPASELSTPTPRRRRSPPSWTRCDRSPVEEVIDRLADLLRRLNPVLRGWCNYFRHGVSQRTFSYVDYYAFWRVFGWLHKRHLGLNKHTLARRHLPDWKINDDGIELFRPETVAITRYRFRGSQIPNPWASTTTGPAQPAA